jgi:hypothetical protein
VETDKEESDGEIEARKAAITKYIQSLPALTLSEEPEFGEHASLVWSACRARNERHCGTCI